MSTTLPCSPSSERAAGEPGQRRQVDISDLIELERRVEDTSETLYRCISDLHEALISRRARRRLRHEIRMSDGLLAWAGTTFEQRRTQAIIEDHMARIRWGSLNDEERTRRADAALTGELEHYASARSAGEITRREARFLIREAHRHHAEAITQA